MRSGVTSVPRRVFENIDVPYLMIASGCALRAVTVRTPESISVARPPALAYWSADSFWAAVTAFIDRKKEKRFIRIH
jgi:hypothetical protein